MAFYKGGKEETCTSVLYSCATTSDVSFDTISASALFQNQKRSIQNKNSTNRYQTCILGKQSLCHNCESTLSATRGPRSVLRRELYSTTPVLDRQAGMMLELSNGWKHGSTFDTWGIITLTMIRADSHVENTFGRVDEIVQWRRTGTRRTSCFFTIGRERRGQLRDQRPRWCWTLQTSI